MSRNKAGLMMLPTFFFACIGGYQTLLWFMPCIEHQSDSFADFACAAAGYLLGAVSMWSALCVFLNASRALQRPDWHLGL